MNRFFFSQNLSLCKSYTCTVASGLGLLLLSGCGDPARLQGTPTREPFISTTNPETKIVMNYERDDLSQIQRPAQVPKDEKLKNELSAKIKNVKISPSDYAESDAFNIVIRREKLSEIEFSFNGIVQPGIETSLKDKTQKFALRLRCDNTDCDQAWMLLKEVASGRVAEIRYQRKTEYLKKTDLAKITVSGPQAELVKEAVEYAFPIERHSSTTTFGRASDLLVIARPAADTEDEEFLEDDAQPAPAAPVATPNPSHEATPEVVEFETIRSVTPPAESPKPSPAPKLPKDHSKKIVKNPTPPATLPTVPVPTPKPLVETEAALEENELTLTTDPMEAYDIEIPKQLFPGKTQSVRDPLFIPASFSITPIHEQKAFEPAYRMKVLAEAFIQQKVKVYLNACNIYVRSVMTLAGYTGGKYYNANNFHRVFETPQHNLNQWRRDGFTYKTAPFQLMMEQGRLREIAHLIPEGYVTVMQVDRSAARRHGHVSFLTKENNELVIYDSAIRAWGPRRTVVTEKKLITRSRQKVIIYSLPKLISWKLAPQGV